MHAGNIEHSNTFERRAAEVQDDAITLRVKIQINPIMKNNQSLIIQFIYKTA